MKTSANNNPEGDEETGGIGSDHKSTPISDAKFQYNDNSEDQEIKAERVSRSSSNGNHKVTLGRSIDGNIDPKK